MFTEKPVAVIDYSVDGLSGALICSWLKVPSVIISVIDGAPFPTVSTEDYSAVIHSGSSHSIIDDTSFINDASSLVNKLIETSVPQMGICYGFQLLARATMGINAVSKCSAIEIGWKDVNFLPQWPDPSLSGVKAVWQSHYDCVTEIPPGSVIIATNNHTKIQGFLNKELKLFGTQFHPEFDHVHGNECFAKDEKLFRENGVNLEDVLASGPGFKTGEVVFNHFLKAFRQEK